MKKVYKSKIGLELVIPLAIFIGTIFLLTFNSKPMWLSIAIYLPIILFLTHLFKTTYYTIDGDKLIVKAGFIINETIAIHSVKKITETNSMASSPAASLDRLEITYGKYDSILISPEMKKEFIQEMVSINPAIEVELKK